MSARDLLIEIGSEELPPTSLKRVATAFKEESAAFLLEQGLEHEGIKWYATPRRLALLVKRLAIKQADRQQLRRGPSLDKAIDENGKFTDAAEGFAKSCGVRVDQLETLETEKGRWLSFNALIKGRTAAELIPLMIETALKRVPVMKRMRWGDNDFEFIRPVKWVLVLFGDMPIDCEILGVKSGTNSYGHRVHHPGAIPVKKPADYPDILKQTGRVLADFDVRRDTIVSQLETLAADNKARALIEPALLDEVTALLEWPQAFIGNFDPDFLKLPREVLIASMQEHQRYFPVVDDRGKLLPYFIGVANIKSRDPQLIKQGNERVIQPRLGDAAFFWERDLQKGLASHLSGLAGVVYQEQLGTLHDRSQRLIKTMDSLADLTDLDRQKATRAAELCFCDLLTEMVGEFPKLQGVMGRYYAEAAGESAEIAHALGEFYRPRFASDVLPMTNIGQCLALAEKIDTLVGMFAIDKVPTGDKDPFALRRAAIGLLRIGIEGGLDIDIRRLIQIAGESYRRVHGDTLPGAGTPELPGKISCFLMERLRHYYIDKGIEPDIFEAVHAVSVTRLTDFDKRLCAVAEFSEAAEAGDLITMNKRISHILEKSDAVERHEPCASLFVEKAESGLADALEKCQRRAKPLIDRFDYRAALTELAALRENVDTFFDDVMVMCDEQDIKNNRLALLRKVKALFLDIADISKLRRR